VEPVQGKIQQLRPGLFPGGIPFPGSLLVLLLACWLLSGCVNPFAPGRDNGAAVSACDPHTVDGIFQCFQAAYTFRDTMVYGPLIDAQFIFVYRDYDLGIDQTWGRDEEMRSTYGLFQNAQKLDLIWNNVISTSAESTTVNVVRGFSLTVVFNASDIEQVSGYANLTLQRTSGSDPWTPHHEPCLYVP
jgi:hypothetical protein